MTDHDVLTDSDAAAAGEASGRLTELAITLADELPSDHGQTLSLALAMFVAGYLSTLPSCEDRKSFCAAVLGLALQTDASFAEWKRGHH